MSAAGSKDDGTEIHDLAAGHDVTEPVDQLDERHTARSWRPASSTLKPSDVDMDGLVVEADLVVADALNDDTTQQSLPRSGLAPNIAAWDTRTDYLEAAGDELLPPPGFKPFFALVEDPNTGEYHHPTTHYVFSDDEDQSVLTSAALAAIDYEETGTQDVEVEERIVMLDMQGDGRTVLAAASLSPDWQALRTEISPAPSWGDSQQSGDKGLMLKIFGKETSVHVVVASQDKSNVDVLVERFGRQLESLDELLGKEDEQIDPADVVSASESQRPGSEVE